MTVTVPGSRSWTVASLEAELVELRALVRSACAAPGCRVGAEFFDEHVAIVERFTRRLAPGLQAREDVVLPAAILHDIAAIEDFSRVSEHHTLGAARARAIVGERGAPDDVLDALSSCVRRHVTPVRRGEGSAEEICLSHADALAQMANPSYWLCYGHRVRGLAFSEARSWYRNLVEDRWSRIDDCMRDLARPHYTRALGACLDDRGS